MSPPPEKDPRHTKRVARVDSRDSNGIASAPHPAGGYGLMIPFRGRHKSSNSIMREFVFKIATVDEWSEAATTGIYAGSADDRRDGFIHLSAQHQLQGTLEKHFKGKDDLVLIAFEASRLEPQLRWEQSRGGELFPHLYQSIAVSSALWQRPLQKDNNGIARIDEAWFVC